MKPPKKKQKKTLAAASQPSTALYTASLHTVLAVERIVQAHGLYSFDAVKRANKAKDADPASQDYFDQLPYKVTAIHHEAHFRPRIRAGHRDSEGSAGCC